MDSIVDSGIVSCVASEMILVRNLKLILGLSFALLDSLGLSLAFFGSPGLSWALLRLSWALLGGFGIEN